MMDVVHRGPILREATKLRTEDLVSCYKKLVKSVGGLTKNLENKKLKVSVR